MPFDEDLRRQFEALTDRIRAEVTRQLALATDELTASVDAERVGAVLQAAADARAEAEQEASARLRTAVAEAQERGRSEGWDAARQDGVAQGRLEGRAEGRAEALAEGRAEGLAEGRVAGREDARAEARATELAAGERLVEAVRTIDGAHSLSEILDALASRAGREAARVGVLLVRGGVLRGWRFIGFEAALDEASAFDLPLEEGGVIADAVGSGEAVSADSSQGTAVPSFAKLGPGREMLAVPIGMNGQVVAVLYADQAGDDPARPGHAEPLVWPAILEVLARHATRCLETVTAFRAAQILTKRSETPTAARVPGGSIGGQASAPAAATSEAGPGDQDEAARRYARLLIADIRLYHEPELIAGRRDRDVAVRLGGEISRARVLYEQRVPAHIRGATDHFHAELVRTLANGDPSLLGQAT